MATAPAPDPARWRALAVVAAGVALIIIDATIVNVALPTIITDLDLRLATAEWVNTTYALVFAALLIVAGRLADLHGRRRLYLTGLVVFTAASVLAGLAPTGGLLVGARVLQGLGGAMVLPATLSIVNATFTGKERAAAFGVWGATIGGMAALGPLAGTEEARFFVATSTFTSAGSSLSGLPPTLGTSVCEEESAVSARSSSSLEPLRVFRSSS